MSSNRVGDRPIRFGCAWCRTYHFLVDLREDEFVGVDINGVNVNASIWFDATRSFPLHINNQVLWRWRFHHRHGDDTPNIYPDAKAQTLHLGPIEGSAEQGDGSTFLYLLW